MLSRDWLAGIALGLAFSLSGPLSAQVSPEQSEPNQAEGQRQESGGQAGPAPFSVPVRILEEPEESESAEREQQKATQREIEDLLAQQSMADSTKEIVFWTRLQVVLATLGTIALIYTILLNRKATLAAIRAADTARDAIGVERAWILLLGQSIYQMRDVVVNGVLHDQVVGFDLRWQNFGRSPAVNAVGYADFRIVDAEKAIPKFVATAKPDNSSSVVAQGTWISTNTMTISMAEFEAIKEHKQFLYIYGIFTYEDTFHPGITRTTEGCYLGQFQLRGEEGAEPRPTLILFPKGTQNTAT